ncbi:opacity protein-like surface antigen [Labrenzia sp. MBR-25]
MPAKKLKNTLSSRALLVGLGAILAATQAVPALAADLNASVPPVPAEEAVLLPQWRFEVAPYFWAAGMSGQVASFGAPGAQVNMGFSDILDDLDFSVMVAGEARYDRFSLTTDLIYLKLSTSETTPRGILVSSIGLDSSMTTASALAGYSILERPNVRLDAVLGGRLWSVENTLKFDGGLFGGRSYKDSATWIDAMGGVKGRVDFSDRFYFTGSALAGGGSSNFGWDLMGGLGYEMSDHFSAVAGYRALGVDYQDGDFEFDVTIQGPIVGVALKF